MRLLPVVKPALDPQILIYKIGLDPVCRTAQDGPGQLSRIDSRLVRKPPEMKCKSKPVARLQVQVPRIHRVGIVAEHASGL